MTAPAPPNVIAPMPAEWAPQRAMFLGFPSDAALWETDLAPARAEVAALARQLAATVSVRLAVATEDAMEAARRLLDGAAGVELLPLPFGDIWLRDTGPLFRAASRAVAFAFNGWGGKYRLAGDEGVAARLAAVAGARLARFDLVCEGGALDTDGQGLAITTEQCLLNPNRNPGLGKAEVEAVLREALGVGRLVWLGEGLEGDHTDGHVDNLARFAAPSTLLIPRGHEPDDPNARAYADARARARAANLVVIDMPSPGRVERDGEVVPASYMNFLVANGQVLVPLYGRANDAAAVRALARAFPRHRVTGLRSDHLLSGGGSFHCISQQQPA
jgi:agmatine deiminase